MYSVTMHSMEDKQRFHALYQASYTRMSGYALRRTPSPEDAADAVADTFAVAWRKLDEIPAGEEGVLWLYGVARRVLSNQCRKRRSRAEVVEVLARDFEEAVWTDPLPEPGIGKPLSEAWTALSDDDRDLLGLLIWETLTVEQIAAVCGCSCPVAKVRLHRARRRFARELERRGYPLKPETMARHVQAGRAEALPDSEAM